MSEARINPAASLPINLPKPAKSQGTVAGESMDPNMPLAPLNSNEKPSFNQMLAKSNGQSSSPMVAVEHDGLAKGDGLVAEEASVAGVTLPSEVELELNILDGANVNEPSELGELPAQQSAVARKVADIEAQKAWIEGVTLDRQSVATESGVDVDVADVELAAISSTVEPNRFVDGATPEVPISEVSVDLSEGETANEQALKANLSEQSLQTQNNESNSEKARPLTAKGLSGDVGSAKAAPEFQASAFKDEASDRSLLGARVSEAAKIAGSALRVEGEADTSEKVGDTMMVRPADVEKGSVKGEIAAGIPVQSLKGESVQGVDPKGLRQNKVEANRDLTAGSSRSSLTESLSATKTDSALKEAVSQTAQAAKEALVQQSQASSEVKLASEMPLRQKMGLDRMMQDRWGRALGQRALLMAQTGPNRMDIQLDPPELGLVQIRVTAGAAGEPISIQFQAANPAVRDALELHQQRLRDMLAEQGLDMSFARSGSENSSDDGDEGRPGASRGHWNGEPTNVMSEGLVPVGLVDFYL